ncbi:TPA: S41 family peptidase [Candidatus Berkelbacteria bacterium]|uniref:Carboxy-terminal-processing protease, carboxyl-terminal processing protease n=1 Tax=Berkelbacteria bacterium GW2011_GWE1_39_12 TaxID=1618337 RepID=A0A0G4B4W6_9BACT|nr:MAG: carboxy-terminal-processing protease, carboxyl-terminal processing protease [Berkelbacteria bacterium GW2011_GWE1_39_12]HBO60572.1 S41 family peptidase [Candidatus Berkelbacteria bacterium]
MKKNLRIKRIQIGIGIAIFIVAGFFGYLIGHQNLVFERTLRPRIVNKELYKPRDLDFSLFWDTWNKVTGSYVGNFDSQKMLYGAMKGMVGAVGDPYTYFMDPTETKAFSDELSGQFSGIGAQLDVKDNVITIVAPLAESPAEKAGLKPQDQILKINGTDTNILTIDQAVSMIRGDENTKVKLVIMRKGWTDSKEFEITRAKITVKSVNWQMKDDNIAYISIGQFGDDTTPLMQQAAKEIADKKPKAIILDLRSNPGGYLNSSVDVTSFFVKKGSVVVREKDKNGHVTEEKTSLDPILKDYKVIVLVNGGSASAAEITAGALQDLNDSVLIGEKTFGKGSVQGLEELKDGSTLRVTIAHWFTPKDRAIDKQGIEPDIKVIISEDDIKAGHDPQLDRALEEVKK